MLSGELMSAKQMVGIILATYQADERFLRCQIDSMKQQSWPCWVCHIVDDASPASVRMLISQLTQDDPRFVTHFHTRNVNAYYNFERGLEYLQDDPRITAIAFADQDDIWHKHKLSTLIELMEADNADMVHSDLELIDKDDNTLCNSVWQYEGRHPEKLDAELLLLRNTVTGCTMMFRHHLLPFVLPFPEQKNPGDWYHDHWVALVACHCGEISHLRKPLVRYRQHGNNTIGARKHTGTVWKELELLIQKKCRLTRKSYRIHLDLSQAFYKRFYSGTRQKYNNPLSDQNLDFGLAIFKLGCRSLWTGYGSAGISLRLIVNKFLFDCAKLKRLIAKKLAL